MSSTPDQYQIFFAYVRLLEQLEREDDLPDDVLATAPVPSGTADELLERDLSSTTEAIVAWVQQHADLGVEQRLIEIAARHNGSGTRLPGGLGHGDPDEISDHGGEGHLGNAVEDSIQTIRRILGADDVSSPTPPQADGQ